MKSRIPAVAAILSLIFLAILIWRWIVSNGCPDSGYQFSFRTGSNSAAAVYISHRVDNDIFNSKLQIDGGRAPGDEEQYDANYIQRYEVAGFVFERDMATPPSFGHYVADRSGDPGPCHWDIELPIWLLVLALPILPFGQAQEYLLRRKHYEGLCVKCGYDLRATPDRCPECGQSVRRT